MRNDRPTRRDVIAASLALCATRALGAQSSDSAHRSVASMEHNRILSEAKVALAAPIVTLTAIAAPVGHPGDFVSNLSPSDGSQTTVQPAPFRAHAIALRDFSTTVATLTAAFFLTSEAVFGQRVAEHLEAWFVAPATRMNPQADFAGSLPLASTGSMTSSASGKPAGTSAGIMDLVPLAEIARASSFVTDALAAPPERAAAVTAWFSALAGWLGSDRQMMLARDAKDHRASAWLFLSTALARATRDDKALDECRRRFRRPTLRNQITEDGRFPQEAATPNPYRNTLMNFDLLAGACQLLTTPFDDEWNYELQDGPGMRSVAAFLYPLIADRNKWPFVSDAEFFRELPGRRPALLFAGRAFNQPQYVQLWQSLPAVVPREVAASFPIRQPLLWTARAPHGL